MTLARLERSDEGPAYKAVASAIEAMLADGRLTPGQALPNEADLAQRFGVNRSTIREGLRVLEDTGFVQRPSPRKLIASLPTARSLAHRTSRAMQASRVSIRDVWETDLAIEPMMARIAAKRAQPHQIAKLTANVLATEKANANGYDLSVLDEEFHLLIGEASNNQALIIAREPIKTLFMPVIGRLVDRADTGARLVEAHRRIVEAIERHDSDVAELWARRHLEDFARGCQLAGVDMNETIQLVPPTGVSA
jgi:GntR family transcriptional regulator, transcriptional repressor for pyruvate dehydrogenase complex